MSPLPQHLQDAIETGELTDEQLRELITLEARALGLSFEDVLARAQAGTLPKNYIGADLELLVDLLLATPA
jgi:hypothetical protein